MLDKLRTSLVAGVETFTGSIIAEKLTRVEANLNIDYTQIISVEFHYAFVNEKLMNS